MGPRRRQDSVAAGGPSLPVAGHSVETVETPSCSSFGRDRWGCPRPGGALAILHKSAMMGISFGSQAQLALEGRNRPGTMPTGGTSGSMAAKRSNTAPLAFAAGGAARCLSGCGVTAQAGAVCRSPPLTTLPYALLSATSGHPHRASLGTHHFLAGLRHSGCRCGSRPRCAVIDAIVVGGSDAGDVSGQESDAVSGRGCRGRAGSARRCGGRPVGPGFGRRVGGRWRRGRGPTRGGVGVGSVSDRGW